MWKSGALAPRPPAGTLKGFKPQWSPFQFFETERLELACDPLSVAPDRTDQKKTENQIRFSALSFYLSTGPKPWLYLQPWRPAAPPNAAERGTAASYQSRAAAWR